MKKLFQKITNNFKKNKRGFSLIELIVVIAIMVVIAVVLVPSLMGHVEESRAEKDIKTTDELVTAVELALADQDVYDEMLEHSIWDNISCYIDQSNEADCANKVLIKAASDGQTEQYMFDDDERQSDEVLYYGAGNMRGVTITFTPVKDSNESEYILKDAVINKFTGRMTGYLYENEKLYNAVRAVIGDTFTNTSQTYRNSDFTIFIHMGTTGINDTDNQDAVKVYGQYNGTNLPYDNTQTCVMATSRVVSEENETDAIVNEAINMASNETIEFSESSLMGSGVVYNTTTNSTAESIYAAIEKAPTPGLFDESGNQLKTWQELLDEGSIVVENGVLRGGVYTPYSNISYYQYKGTRGVLVVDSSVSSIRERAFGGGDSSCSPNLIKVVLPNSVKTIGNYAFKRCEKLTNVEFGKGLTNIGNYAFERCYGLESIMLPKNVTYVGNCAFGLCRNVESITIESGNTQFDHHALYYIDYKLTSVVLPDGMTTISGSMFNLCSKLKTVTIPSSVTSIGYSAFARSGITEVYYGGTIAQWNAISKYTSSRDSYWNNGCSKMTVHCTDGDTTVAACSYYSGFF